MSIKLSAIVMNRMAEDIISDLDNVDSRDTATILTIAVGILLRMAPTETHFKEYRKAFIEAVKLVPYESGGREYVPGE